MTNQSWDTCKSDLLSYLTWNWWKVQATLLSSQENLKNNCYLFTCSLCSLIVILQALVTIINIFGCEVSWYTIKTFLPQRVCLRLQLRTGKIMVWQKVNRADMSACVLRYLRLNRQILSKDYYLIGFHFPWFFISQSTHLFKTQSISASLYYLAQYITNWELSPNSWLPLPERKI